MAEELLRHLIIPSKSDSRFCSSPATSLKPVNSFYQNSYSLSSQPPSLEPDLRHASRVKRSNAASDPAGKHYQINSFNYNMADELRERIPMPSNEDSYYSATSAPSMQPTNSTQQTTGSNQPSQRLDMVDVDAFLQQNAQLLDHVDFKSKSEPSSVTLAVSKTDATNPEPRESRAYDSFAGAGEGTTRSATITGLFVHECQSRGLSPVWDIKEHPQRFGGAVRFIGTVTIANQTLELKEAQPSKKDVRALLARMALPVAEATSKVGHGANTAGGEKSEDINWIGKLLGEWSSFPAYKPQQEAL